jgi:membrane protein DedA with SNARE-associated domain
MSPEFQHLISVYGYWLMLFGALIEGETFLIAGGIAAQQGLLQIQWVLLFALVGSTLHDNTFFALGRYGGRRFLDNKPTLQAKAEGVLTLFDKYGSWLVLALRFLYGLRTMIPVVLGMSHIKGIKFFWLDVIGGIVWSVLFVGGGYVFGSALTAFMHRIGHFETLVGRSVIVIIVFAVFLAIGVWWYRKYKKQ